MRVTFRSILPACTTRPQAADSGISSAALTAVLLNIVFNVAGRKDKEGPIFAEAPPPGVAPSDNIPGGPAAASGHGYYHRLPGGQAGDPAGTGDDRATTTTTPGSETE